ncbi:hypothetical protein [Succinimonas sp.]|uniref:hypothetical protein n=1 Tax=Succinimonas sp. TaxID=1936151 RepID=UPI003864B88B
MERNNSTDTGSNPETNQVKDNVASDTNPKLAECQTEEHDLDERRKDLDHREKLLTEREQKLNSKETELSSRENNLKERESAANAHELEIIKLQNNIQEQQNKLKRQQELAMEQIKSEQLKEKSDFEKSLLKEREKHCNETMEQMEACRKKYEAFLAKKEEEWQKSVQEREEKLDQREKDLNSREDDLDAKSRKLKREEQRQNARDEDLDNRENNLGARLEESISSRIAAYKKQIEDKDRELAEVREDCRQLNMERDAIETFKVSIGETPEIIEKRQKNLEQEIKSLQQKLISQAPEFLERDFKELQKMYKQTEAELEDARKNWRILEQKNQGLAQFEIENAKLVAKNKELESLNEELKSQTERYRERIQRLTVNEANLSEREARVAEIRKGFLPPLTGAGLPNEQSEIRWLQNISEKCTQYGVYFPRRILYAFHTALKISDWSSITVLAGVSGTGKSELPKLYAAFGGLNFIAVPVQPNWDSQESMLGFFNSIDNRFEPEDLLRFLVQCTEDDTYKQYMSIVLLDEMNLAHVEHYFADFLSKLESRRGSSKSDLPSVEVKLGAGVQPYRLNLSRSILWTGTMNQDETTKSLSDKVLDRGLVINFPRPQVLRDRNEMPILQKHLKDRTMLKTQTWETWLTRKIKLEGNQLKELDRYRKIVERINDELEHVGRALGHRVWQSIEYYMMNYPTVSAEYRKQNENNHGEISQEQKKAMKVAFEDQIVQKIMPKLRGVETRGHAKISLDAIETLLEEEGFESLKDDFKIACEQGYGQFIWSSAKYIEADEAENSSAAVNNKTDDAEAVKQG